MTEFNGDISIGRKLLIAAAEARGLAVSKVGYPGHASFFMKVTHPDGRFQLILGTLSFKTSVIGNLTARNKHLSAAFLEQQGYKGPETLVYDTMEHAVAFLKKHGTIVVKPADGKQTLGVTVSITNQTALEAAIAIALQNSDTKLALLQQQLQGRLYRLLVLDGKLVAAAERRAAEATGDGTSTVRQLVERLNQDPRRGEVSDTPLKKIKLADVEAYIGSDGLEKVPGNGETIRLTAIDSISAGGEAINVTDQVHPEYARITQEISTALGLFICGYDIMCDDISEAPDPNYLPMLEMNSGPGLKLHHYPTGGGEPIDVAGMFLDRLFDL